MHKYLCTMQKQSQYAIFKMVFKRTETFHFGAALVIQKLLGTLGVVSAV